MSPHSPLVAAWAAAIAQLQRRLHEVFTALDARTRLPAPQLAQRPANGGWTALEVLEHVALTDRYLLLLASKLLETSRRRAARSLEWPAHPPRFDHLTHIAGRELEWRAPEHMVPSGNVSIDEVRAQLANDHTRCEELLTLAPDGLGTLHRIRMSVVGGEDDRLDLYQYLEVLRLHSARHIAQIDRAASVSARAPDDSPGPSVSRTPR